MLFTQVTNSSRLDDENVKNYFLYNKKKNIKYTRTLFVFTYWAIEVYNLYF